MLVDMCSRAGKLVALDWVTACLPDIFSAAAATMHAQREKAVNLIALERIWPAISAPWVSAALPERLQCRYFHSRATKRRLPSRSYAELPPTGQRAAALLAAEWRVPSGGRKITDDGNQIVKALTMIKRWLPIRFSSIRQTNRM